MDTKICYYSELKDLIDSEALKLIVLVCPPRSGSTLLEHVIGNSDQVDAECHEPFFQVMRHNLDPNEGYKQIYETALRIIRKGKSATVIVKEISCSISRDDEYQRFLSLATSPIIFLVRNPLLSIESRIKKILHSLKFKKRESTLLWIQEEMGSDSYAWFEEGVNLQRQTEGLNSVAQMYEGCSFDELLEEKVVRCRDYVFFTRLLALESERFHVRKSGFEDLSLQVEFVESKGDKFVIIDSTELRLAPKLYLEGIFGELNLSYSDAVLSWSSNNVDFEVVKLGPDKRLWYDTLDASTGVELPKEVPLPLSHFPSFVQHQLLQVEIPIYFNLLRKAPYFTDTDFLGSVRIDLRVTDTNMDMFQEIYVLPKGDLVGSQTVSICDIDPIYSTIRLSQAIRDFEEYKTRKIEYADILEKLIELESGSL